MKESQLETAVFGGGCFWCTEAIFQQLKGVHGVTAGYAGGRAERPTYEEVCTGETGHAEVVKIKYDTAVISYETLLAVFFSTHDPTTLNRQGNDLGTQYRSVIFYTAEGQEYTAQQFIKKLKEERVYEKPIVTELKPLTNFSEAEACHQQYYAKNKEAGYCQFVINPKLEKLREKYAHLLEDTSP